MPIRVAGTRKTDEGPVSGQDAEPRKLTRHWWAGKATPSLWKESPVAKYSLTVQSSNRVTLAVCPLIGKLWFI